MAKRATLHKDRHFIAVYLKSEVNDTDGYSRNRLCTKFRRHEMLRCRGCRIAFLGQAQITGAAPWIASADSLIAFQRMFPHDDACAAWLASVRWPEGFECPRCGHDHGWALRGKAHTFECARCHRQTSVTAGTILHGSKLALTVWFWAAYLMATHSNGIAALQLQNQLGIGSYRSAWLLAAKLRKAMVDPERDCRASSRSTRPRWRSAPRMIPWPARRAQPRRQADRRRRRRGRRRQRAGPPAPGRDRVLRRRKPQPLHRPQHRRRQHRQDRRLGRLFAAPVETHDPHVIGSMAAHLVLPWIHQVFSNLGRAGRAASITGCAPSTCKAISTSSCSASTGAGHATPPSARCSASPCAPSPSPTTCWSGRKLVHKRFPGNQSFIEL